MLAQLREGDAVESDVTLIDKWVEEIIGHGGSVAQAYILPRARHQFPIIAKSMYVSQSLGIKNSRLF